MKRKLTVAGTGALRVTPDVAHLRLGVRLMAPTAAEASRQAADAMTAIMDAVRRQGISDHDIRTGYFAITPEYQHTPEGVAQRIGHSVTNSVQVTITALEVIGALIDAVLAAGGDAVMIEGLNFTLSDLATAQIQARSLALADARRQAEQIAHDMDITLGKPLVITTSPGYHVQYSAGPMMMRAAPMHPIEAGELDVTAQVEVVFAIK